jgi:hypothetical protein
LGYKVSPHTCDGTIIVMMKPSFGLCECACAASGPVVPSKAIADTWDSIDMLATFEDPSDETAAVPISRSPNPATATAPTGFLPFFVDEESSRGGKEEDELYELRFLKLSWAYRYGRHVTSVVGCHWQLGSEESTSVAG